MTGIVEKWPTKLWRPSRERKPRRDSKLHGLAKEQRAMVDKWLFDKGLTYQQVSEACGQMFRLKVSRSSVGRYHERVARGKVRRKKDEGRKGVSGKADEEVSGWAREMCIGMLDGRGTSETEEAYQKTLAWMTKWALEEMQWPVADERDIKTVLRFMRILIAARRERNEAMMVELARRKFETRAARECMKHLRTQGVSEGVGKCVSGRKNGTREKVRAHGRCTEGLHRGEKDPMMTWNFPDGEIRRMPLMRQQAGPAPDGEQGRK